MTKSIYIYYDDAFADIPALVGTLESQRYILPLQ